MEELKRVLPTIERERMQIKVTFQNLEQSESFKKSLVEGHAESHTVILEKPIPDSQLREVYITIEKSLYRVVQDLIKANKKLFT